MAALVGQLEPGAVLVPGHGAPIDRDFAASQRDSIAALGTLVRETHAAGLSPVEARDAHAGSWPLWLNEGFAEHMGSASVAARLCLDLRERAIEKLPEPPVSISLPTKTGSQP